MQTHKIVLYKDDKKWALTNWEEILEWYRLPFYKKWFKKCPTKKFTEIKK